LPHPLITRRVIALAVVAAALAVAAGFMRARLATPQRVIESPSVPHSAPSAAGFDPMSLEQTTPTGVTKLPGVVADLPIYPGASVMLSYQQGDGPGRRQTTVLSLGAGANIEQVLAFYDEAVKKLGFTLKPTPGSSPLGRVYQMKDRMLLLRIRQGQTDVRLTLIVGYTK
jgi:hypothetical protein